MNGANGQTAFNAAKIIFLDSHPLSLLADPKIRPVVTNISNWATSLLAAGHLVYVPEIVDYELRRELLRSGKSQSIATLNAQKSLYQYAPLTTNAMLLAADLWARMRNSGTPTGDPKRLDVDVILAAQALTGGGRLGLALDQVIVAPSNVAHLNRMVPAKLWENIVP